MELTGQTLFVTGAAGAIGDAFVKAAIARGAAKVYAADLKMPEGGERVVPMVLDITDHGAIAHAAQQAGDVTILINNAGVNLRSPLIGSPDLDAARMEMEVNYFGTLAMCRAFAPILASRGGGAIVCVGSILSKVTLPNLGTYCASKGAVIRMIEGVRAELKEQGTSVMAVLPWAVDTPLSAAFKGAKTPVKEVVDGVFDALRTGEEEICFHEFSDEINRRLREDPLLLARELGARFVKAK